MTFIAPESKLLRHLDRLASWRSGQFTPPIGMEIDVSNRCSLGCKNCAFGYTHSRGPLAQRTFGKRPLADLGDLMEPALFVKIREELEAAGVKSITLSGGGEPTMHPEFEFFVGQAACSPIKFGMYTNGTFIDRDRAARLKKSFTWILVSLDEPDAESYQALKQVDQFDSVVSSIRNLVDADGPAVIGVSFLVHQGNVNHLQEMADLGLSLHPTYVEFRPTVLYDLDHLDQPSCERPWIDKAMPSLIKLSQDEGIEVRLFSFREYWLWERKYPVCHSVHFTGVISPNGQVWTCVNRRGFAGSLVGDLSQEPFREVWARVKSVDVFSNCRVLCRGHPLNLLLDRLSKPMPHEEFI